MASYGLGGGYGYGEGGGYGYGYGFGCGCGYDFCNVSSYGYGFSDGGGYGYGFGEGGGCGYGIVYGYGEGCGEGCSEGYGEGYSKGYGYGFGDIDCGSVGPYECTASVDFCVLQIGCQVHSAQYWRENFDRLCAVNDEDPEKLRPEFERAMLIFG